MTFYFGGGFKGDSDPGTAFNEAYKQNRLARLLSDAYQAPEEGRRGLLAQMMGVDANAGFAAAKVLDPRLRAGGEKPSQQQYAEWLLSQAPAEHRDQVLGVLGGYKARPSSAAIQYKPQVGADGVTRMVAYDPNEVGAQVIGSGETYGSGIGAPSAQPQMPPPGAQSAPLAGGQLFAGLGQIPGVQITSGFRTPEKNAKVGGVPNSYHLTDQARDIAPPRTPEQAQQIRQYAAQNGLEIIDEGDHWHLEPARRGAQPAPQRNAPSPFQSRPKEQQQYLDELAQQRAKIETLPAIGRIEAQNAGMKETATQDAQLGAMPRRNDLEAQGALASAANTQFGKDAAEAYGKIQESGRMAAKERSRLLQLRSFLKDTYTGPGANAVLAIKRTASAFGVNVDGLGEGEAARALSNQLAMALRNPSGGEGMPGAMSDADRTFLVQSVPGLANSPSGWRAMVDMRVALADAAVRQAQYAETLRRQGVPIQDIPGRLQSYADSNPVFSPRGVQQSGKVRRYNPATGRLE